MAAPFSIDGAIAAQSAAHEKLETAIKNDATFKVLFNGKPYVTCASYAAAVAFVGKSKRMTIVKA